jgi:ParB family chromosome partitioning protein
LKEPGSAGPKKKTKGRPALSNGYREGSFHHIDVDLISPNPDEPRKLFPDEPLRELSKSIKRKGVLQPVIIRRDKDGKIFLVAGERRLKAAKMAGLKTIPAIITKGNPAEIALIENLQRENLKPMEEAEALNRMIQEYSYTHDKLAGIIGKARSTITETLSLVKLPEEIKEECRRADIYPRRTLVEIARQDTPEAMLALFKITKDSTFTSTQVREITRSRKTRDKNRTSAAITLEKAQALSKHLSELDLAAIEKAEKDPLLVELQTLKAAIDQFLANSSA